MSVTPSAAEKRPIDPGREPDEEPNEPFSPPCEMPPVPPPPGPEEPAPEERRP